MERLNLSSSSFLYITEIESDKWHQEIALLCSFPVNTMILNRFNGIRYMPWIVLTGYSFAWLFCPISCVLHWYLVHNKKMPSTPLRTETAATAADCQHLCATAADSEGCRSVNFNVSSHQCELLNAARVRTFPVRKIGIDFYESCTMWTPHGR